MLSGQSVLAQRRWRPCPERLPWCLLPLWERSKERERSRRSRWCPRSCRCFLAASECSRGLLCERDRDFFRLWPCLPVPLSSSRPCLALAWGEPWLWCRRGLGLWLRERLRERELYVPDRLRRLL